MSKKNNKLSQAGGKVFYYSLIALPLLQFCIFYIYVNFNSILLAFKEYSISGGEKFAGFANFKNVFNALFYENVIKTTFVNSLVLYLFSFFVGTCVSVIFSFYIYKRNFGSELFRVLLFLPNILSSIVLVVIYRYFVVNAVPAYGELLGLKIPDLFDGIKSSKYTILFYCLFTGFGTSSMMYVGAMNNISDSIIESAKIDGFSPLQEFIYITIPMIFPTIKTFIVVGLAGLFVSQMGLFQFYGGDAEPQLWTIGYYIYVQSSRASLADYPYLAAFGLVLTFITMPVVLIVKKLLERFGPRTY